MNFFFFLLLVPPNIDDALTSSDVIVREGDNVTLRCKAKGSPEPSIKWKRDDGHKIVINKTSEGKNEKYYLTLSHRTITFQAKLISLRLKTLYTIHKTYSFLNIFSEFFFQKKKFFFNFFPKNFVFKIFSRKILFSKFFS